MSIFQLSKKSWRTCSLVVAVASVLGLFFAAQMHYSSAAFGRPISWGQALYWAFGDWYEWALLSPVIIWLSRGFSFERSRWRSSLGIHFVGGVMLSVAHLLLCALAEQAQGWVEGQRVSFTASFVRLFTKRGMEAVDYRGEGMIVIADDHDIPWPQRVLANCRPCESAGQIASRIQSRARHGPAPP